MVGIFGIGVGTDAGWAEAPGSAIVGSPAAAAASATAAT